MSVLSGILTTDATLVTCIVATRIYPPGADDMTGLLQLPVYSEFCSRIIIWQIPFPWCRCSGPSRPYPGAPAINWPTHNKKRHASKALLPATFI